MRRKSFIYISTLTATFLLVIGLFFFPDETASSVKSGFSLCYSSVIPSLFPFLFVANLIISLRFTDLFLPFAEKTMSRLFHLPGKTLPAFLMGLLGGYPLGASAASALYKNGDCSKKEFEALISFCNNSGPAFIIGVVGCGLFHSARLGLLLFSIHALSAVTTGVIFCRRLPPKESTFSSARESKKIPPFSVAFTESVFKASHSIINISAYIILFSVFVTLCREFKLFDFLGFCGQLLFKKDAEFFSAFFAGVAEVTVGINLLLSKTRESYILPLVSFLLGWGGFSVHCQTLSIIVNDNINTKLYFKGKLVHALSGTAYMLLFIFIESDIRRLLFCIPLFFLFAIIFFIKKGRKKSNNGVYYIQK